MRDKLKNKLYFDTFINDLNNRIQKRHDKLKNNLIKPDRIQSVKKSMCFQYSLILKAKYCRGDNMFTEDIIDNYKAIVTLLSDYSEKENSNILFYLNKDKKPVFLNQYNISSHINFIDFLSLGILLNVSNSSFNSIVEIIDKDNVKDFLYEFLINSKIKHRSKIEEENFKEFSWYKDRFIKLKHIINNDNKDFSQKQIKQFLEEDWYKALRDTPTYNQHDKTDGNYVGYYCFVAAAIVKIKNLDDSSFRDNKYYPKDLIEYEV